MYDRRNHAKRLLFGGILLGNFAAIFLALVEVVFLVAWEGGARTVGTPRSVLFYDALVILVAGPFVGLLFGSVASAVHLIATRVAGQRQQEPIWKARMHTILAIPVVSYLAVKAFSGPWASALPGSRLLSMATGGLMLAGVYVASRVIVRHGERLTVGHSGRWMRTLAAPTLLGLAVLLYVGDQVVLPRLYLFFHWGLAGLTLLTAWLGVGALHLAFDRSHRRTTGRFAKPLTVVLVSSAVVVLSMVGHRAIGRSNLWRAIVFQRAGLGSKVLALSSRAGILPQPRKLRPIAPRNTGPDLRRPRPEMRGADVVVITVDALRADRLGLFGYRRRVAGKDRSVTPNIDRIFGKGVRFSRAYCTTPRTSYSLVSLLTGQPVYTLAKLGEHRQWPTLAEVLGASFRYRTAGFYPLAVFTIDGPRFERYRSQHLGFEYFKFENEDLPAKRRTDQVIGFFDEHAHTQRTESVFVWAHYFDPHEPYTVRSGFGGFGRSAAARYDAEIAYVDAEIGRLVNAIAERRKRVMFVLTADHGEEFGEHGGANHGTSVFDEQVRVPLLFAGPGLPDRQVDLPVSLTQVPATILRLLTQRVPVSMDARADLTGLMAGIPEHAAGDASGALSEVAHLRMYTRGHHKLLQSTRNQYSVLYDLKRDPGEHKPLGVDTPGSTQKRARELLGHLVHRLSRLEASVRRYRQLTRRSGLTDGLATGSPQGRRVAAAGLMRRAARKGLNVTEVTALRRVLEDRDPGVRHRARIALAAHAGRTGLKLDVAGLRRLLSRPDLPDDMRLTAGLALAAARDPGALAPLVSLLPRLSDIDSRLEVIRALGRLGGTSLETVAVLVRELENTETAVEVMRTLRHLSRFPVAASLVTEAVPILYRLLGQRPEHMGQRSEILTTLACLSTRRSRTLLAEWLLVETERAVRAVGLGLLARLPGGAEEASGLVWRAVAAQTQAPTGACLQGRGCRLEAAPVTLQVQPTADVRGRAATLWLVVQDKTRAAPTVQVDGFPLRPGQAVPIALGEIGRMGRGGELRAPCTRQGRLSRLVWRYVVPAGRLGTGPVRIELRDPSGGGAVVQLVALLPLAPQK
jgi:arylsulfatase A-like enzyme